MKSIIPLAGLVMVLALVLPGVLGSTLSGGSATGKPAPIASETIDRERPVERRVARAERTERKRVRRGRASIPMDARGHFTTEAKLNGKRVEVLVDTGATSVALNRSLAKRLGIRLKDEDFRHFANTANGRTPMAVATLRSVRIGGVEVRDVEAAVLGDASLDGVLLGMSFLGRLKSFGVERGELRLVR